MYLVSVVVVRHSCHCGLVIEEIKRVKYRYPDNGAMNCEVYIYIFYYDDEGECKTLSQI